MELLNGNVDSVLQAVSNGSFTSSACVTGWGWGSKRSALQAKLSHSNIKNELEYKVHELHVQSKKAELETDISAAKAEKETLARF